MRFRRRKADDAPDVDTAEVEDAEVEDAEVEDAEVEDAEVEDAEDREHAADAEADDLEDGDVEADEADEADEDDDEDDEDTVDPRAEGPWDVEENPHDADEPAVIDLGGLIVRGRPGFDLQIPADEGTDQLAAVLLVAEDAAVEIRAFAAPRTGGLWDEVRAEIAEEVARLEGQVEELRGKHGRELQVQVPARTPDGREAVQPSRIVGVEGPRWFLRGTFMGRAALEPDDEGVLELGFREVVVRRGDEAMPPREPIAVVLPEGAIAEDEVGDDDAAAEGTDDAVTDDSDESGQDPSVRET